MAHFSANSFLHDSTGYTLRGNHAEAECRACHRPDLVLAPDVREFKGPAGALAETYLGLGTECADCHAEEDPHQGQFSDQGCGGCHNEEGWEGAAEFDHSKARYPLLGMHQEVECGLCHKSRGTGGGGDRVRYRPVEASDCDACHEDPHRGRMAGSCQRCHDPRGWAVVRRAQVESSFDHGSTRFPLLGAHRRAPCRSCHEASPGVPGVRLRFPSGEIGSRTYPRPRHEACGSCHSDPHRGVFQDEDCDACHGGESWTPSEFGLARHDQESAFSLTGAHRVTPCVACHPPEAEGGRGLRFRIEGFEACRSCHQEEDPHDGVFGEAPCETCHETASFLMETFDHDREGLRPWIQKCNLCHGDTQPHGEQFPGRQCGECHRTDTYEILAFDHSGSRFPLDGAHQAVPCDACHREEVDVESEIGLMVRYRPLDLACVACHGGVP